MHAKDDILRVRDRVEHFPTTTYELDSAIYVAVVPNLEKRPSRRFWCVLRKNGQTIGGAVRRAQDGVEAVWIKENSKSEPALGEETITLQTVEMVRDDKDTKACALKCGEDGVTTHVHRAAKGDVVGAFARRYLGKAFHGRVVADRDVKDDLTGDGLTMVPKGGNVPRGEIPNDVPLEGVRAHLQPDVLEVVHHAVFRNGELVRVQEDCIGNSKSTKGLVELIKTRGVKMSITT